MTPDGIMICQKKYKISPIALDPISIYVFETQTKADKSPTWNEIANWHVL